jgi:hypothetical protein
LGLIRKLIFNLIGCFLLLIGKIIFPSFLDHRNIMLPYKFYDQKSQILVFSNQDSRDKSKKPRNGNKVFRKQKIVIIIVATKFAITIATI